MNSIATCLFSALMVSNVSAVMAGDFLAPTYEYRDQQLFLNATGAANASGLLPNGPSAATSLEVGAVTFQSHPPSTLNFADWTDGLPGSFALALNGDEEFNVLLTTPELSFGIEIEQADRTHPNINGANVNSDFEVTLCGQTFPRGEQCPASAVISTHRFNPPQSGPPNYQPSFIGLWAQTAIHQVSIRELTTADGNEFFGQVFSGNLARATPNLDQFESDNQPQSASTLELFRTSSFDRQFVQFHTLHNSADEDWIFHNSRLDRIISLMLISQAADFHAQVEFYQSDRFDDPQTPPVNVLGDCNASPMAINDILSDAPGFTLLRIVRCSGDAPVDYELRYTVTLDASFSNEQTFRLFGSVTTASTGSPVGAFIRSNNGEAGFSNPASGSYQMVLTKNIEHTITIESPNFEIRQEVIEPVSFFESQVELNLQVTPQGILFANGFE